MKTLLAALILLSTPLGLARAGDLSHDQARRAVQDGRILPLKDILARAEAAHPGQLIEAELEESKGVLVYELKLLAPDGRVVKLHMDAASGQILRSQIREPKP